MQSMAPYLLLLLLSPLCGRGRPLWSGFQAAIIQHVSRAMPANVGTGGQDT